ncbi:MAG: hydroxymethylbilane synthase [Chthoniobacterales bacterium]
MADINPVSAGKRRIVLGSRGSELARRQTALVEERLRAAAPDLEVEIKIIRTRGDEGGADRPVVDASQGRKGMFTAEIERALRAGQIDAAVHSAKDLPSEMTAGLAVCATLARAPMEDVLISKEGGGFDAIPQGATIATGSVRRQHQLRRLRPDLEVVDLRGNVPTRVRKLAANPWAGIILARAGLERLGYDCTRGHLDFEGSSFGLTRLRMEDFLPAGGQGVIALQACSDDAEICDLLGSINHVETFHCLCAEREFLRLLQGDCGTPVGVIAIAEGGSMTMRAQLFDGKSGEVKTAVASGKEPKTLAAQLWEMING